MDVFDYLDWQQGGRLSSAGSTVVMIADRRMPAPATLNGASPPFVVEYAVLAGRRGAAAVWVRFGVACWVNT